MAWGMSNCNDVHDSIYSKNHLFIAFICSWSTHKVMINRNNIPLATKFIKKLLKKDQWKNVHRIPYHFYRCKQSSFFSWILCDCCTTYPIGKFVRGFGGSYVEIIFAPLCNAGDFEIDFELQMILEIVWSWYQTFYGTWWNILGLLQKFCPCKISGQISNWSPIIHPNRIFY